MGHPVKYGKNERISFSKTREVLEMPNLIEVQVNSYKNFLENGLREVFKDVFPIANYSGNFGEYTRIRYDDKWGSWRFIPYQ